VAAARHPAVSDLLGGQVKVEIVHVGHGGEAGGQAASGAAGMGIRRGKTNKTEQDLVNTLKKAGSESGAIPGASFFQPFQPSE